MAYYGWSADAPTGVYKNHAISNKLLEWAAENYVVAQFATEIPGYGKQKGETINIFHYDQVTHPTSVTLTEGTDIPLDTMTMGSNSLTVEEIGRGIEVTNLAEQLSKFSPYNQAQKQLQRQLKHEMDKRAATAFKTALVCAIGTGASAITWDTDGTASTAATVNLTADHMGIIRDYLVNDLHVPPYDGDGWRGIFTTKALRGLKSDSDLIAWSQYLQEGDLIHKSEVGMIESIRLIECTQEDAFSNSIGTGNVTGEGVIFGDEGLAEAVVTAPHLRLEPNKGQDFGRMMACAWYAIQKYGLYWATANDFEAKVIRWTSS